MRTLAFERHQRCFLLVQGKGPATDEEWAQWVDFVGRGGRATGGNICVLVFSAGGSPTPKQRKMIHDIIPREGEGVSTAVVLDSSIARAVVTAMALFNPSVRAFHPERVREAFDYLRLEGSLRDELMELARRQHAELKLPFTARL